ncbi:MAG: tetratricopeptide repeat protein [Myxococcales bacterium]|nr:tetratricopeptide repeat protein [Myxococcales bacterium]
MFPSRAFALVFAIVLSPVSLACGGGGASVDSALGESSASGKRSKHKSSRKRADSADTAYLSAIDAEADEDFDKASEFYSQALKLDSTHRRANQRYVHFLIDRGRTSRALKVAKRFYEEVPSEAISYHTLADAQAAAGEHDQVVGTMGGLLAFSEEDAIAFEKRGRARLTIGEDAEGIRDIRRAVDMEPDNPDFRNSLGAGLLRAGKRKEAQRALKKSLQLDTGNGRAHLLLGILARMEGNGAEARSHHESALESDPDDARAQYELGISCNQLGDNEAAEAAFAKAVDLEPERGNYWYGYGDLLHLMGRLEESAAAYRQSVKLEPNNARAWERLGEVLIKTGQLSSAAKSLKRGIGRVEHPRLSFLLAQVYAKAKKEKRARETLENYLDEAPRDAPDRAAAEKMLRRLQR